METHTDARKSPTELNGRPPDPEKENAAPDEAGNGVNLTAAIKFHYGQQHTGVSPLDQPLAVSMCRNLRDTSPDIEQTTLRQFADRMRATRAKNKTDLPLIKLGTFKGGVAGQNLDQISGIEGDYDSGKIGPVEAERLLRSADIAALVYTSASHTPDAPRWRVLCPTSAPLSPNDRTALIERVNGALGGILAPESFTIAQRYFYGDCDSALPVDVRLVEGRFIDAATDVKRIGKFVDLFSDPAPKPDQIFINLFDEKPDWPKIRNALRYLTNADDRDTWRDIGAALHHESSGSDRGFQVWCDWSEQSHKFNSKDQRHTWRGFGRNAGARLTIGTLFHRAKVAGWNNIEITPDDFDDLPEIKSQRLRFLSPADCEGSPSRGYVIKGLLAPKDIACIFGAPGAGKSLLAPFLGYMAAKGVKAFGMRTKATGVFYVAAEDAHGMRGRVKALRSAHGDVTGFQLVEGVSDLLATGSPDLIALKAAVKEQRPSLIFIDTLAMAFPGLEENSAEAMGRVVAVARALTRYGAAVVLIHHDTKAADATPRGHSLLNGALDVALHVKRDEGGIIRGNLTKNRNGPCDRDIAFTIELENAGVDEDGDNITLPRCFELESGESFMPRLTAGENAALDILEAEMRVMEMRSDEMDCAPFQVPIDDWRKSSWGDDRLYSGDNRKSFNTAFKRAVKGLGDKGVIQIVAAGDGGNGCVKLSIIRGVGQDGAV
jgi:AAA domain/Primase C terminal 2 (PriCT-2)